MNIYDIARLAGVSSATVSRVLNHAPHVSAASREKVEAVIREQGFIPNAIAQTLNTRQSRTIGIVCPVISDLNHAIPVAELTRLLRSSQYESLLVNTETNLSSKRSVFTSLIERQVDAIIVIGCNTTAVEKADFLYAASRLPVFIVNGYIEGENIYCTLCDEGKVTYEAARTLLSQGCSSILYLYDSETYSGHEKLAGYTRAMKESGLPLLVRRVVSEGTSYYKSLAVTCELLESTSFDAVIAADDSLALGAGKARILAGLPPVPMLGFNNTMLSQVATPSLSSVDNRIKQQCLLTVQSLLTVLQGNSAAARITLDGEIIVRSTFQKNASR